MSETESPPNPVYNPPPLRPSQIPPSLHHLTPQDQQTFLHNSFGTQRPIPFPVVHHAFEWHARTQPDAICIEHEALGDRITYRKVESLSNRLARRIKNLINVGVDANAYTKDSPDLRICILARRSVHFVIAILAVLKSSAQYVPIDAATVTDEALLHIIRDSEPELVLVMEEFEDRLLCECRGVSTPTPKVLCIERAVREDEALGADDTKPEDMTRPEDGCYVIYTSGTTGVPKGVDVRHIGVSNVICAPPGNVYMKPGTRVAHLLNIAFDMAVWEILSSLYNGCTLCLRGNTFKEWVRLLKSVDVVISTPSILARHDPKEYQNIKHVIVGGEVCPQSLADSWALYTQFNNCCGPTEISVCNTIQPHTPGYPLSIGTPIPNTSVYILSQDYDPDPDPDPNSSASASESGCTLPPPRALPIGETGCMWVGGIGVSKGYLNLPDKTRERWLPDPFRSSDGTTYMMFNTNDLGRWREDGQLEHCGRADDQVKVKGGFRVELDGVASAMMRCENVVSRAVALLVDGVLWGFVVRKPRDEKQGDEDEEKQEDGCGEEREIEQVEKCTREVMSHYAVPERWMIMDEFPMTRNGKVDKRVLVSLARKKERERECGGGSGVSVDSGSSSTSISSVSRPTTPITELDDLDVLAVRVEQSPDRDRPDSLSVHSNSYIADVAGVTKVDLIPSATASPITPTSTTTTTPLSPRSQKQQQRQSTAGASLPHSSPRPHHTYATSSHVHFNMDIVDIPPTTKTSVIPTNHPYQHQVEAVSAQS